MSVSTEITAWVFTCGCSEFVSEEFPTQRDAQAAFNSLADAGEIPAHGDYCEGALGGGVEPAVEELWKID